MVVRATVCCCSQDPAPNDEGSFVPASRLLAAVRSRAWGLRPRTFLATAVITALRVCGGLASSFFGPGSTIVVGHQPWTRAEVELNSASALAGDCQDVATSE